jgi:hypothetical protein
MDLGIKYQGKIATIVVVLYQKSFVKHEIGSNLTANYEIWCAEDFCCSSIGLDIDAQEIGAGRVKNRSI